MTQICYKRYLCGKPHFVKYSTYIVTLSTLLILCWGAPVRAQMIPEPTGDEAIYLFLDELAADGVITLNGVEALQQADYQAEAGGGSSLA